MTTENRRLTRDELEQTSIYRAYVQRKINQLGEAARLHLTKVVDDVYGESQTIVVSDGFFGILDNGLRNIYNNKRE